MPNRKRSEKRMPNGFQKTVLHSRTFSNEGSSMSLIHASPTIPFKIFFVPLTMFFTKKILCIYRMTFLVRMPHGMTFLVRMPYGCKKVLYYRTTSIYYTTSNQNIQVARLLSGNRGVTGSTSDIQRNAKALVLGWDFEPFALWNLA